MIIHINSTDNHSTLFSGFTQPEVVTAMLNQVDFDGFNDRHIIVCQSTPNYLFKELVADDTEINLGHVHLAIYKVANVENLTLTLSDEATAHYRLFYNDMVHRMHEVLCLFISTFHLFQSECFLQAVFFHYFSHCD